MALPSVPPYPMPAGADLPASRVDWEADPSRAVLLVHDLQNHFLSAFAPDTSPLTDLLAAVARLTGRARRLGVPVVYSAQPGGQSPSERGLQTDFWGPGLPADGHAPAIAAAVAPQDGDTVLTKWKYSAFARTDLAGLLAGQGRDQLVVTGVYAHLGVVATACDAWMRDIQPFVVADAVADFGPREHLQALHWAARACARVLTADAVFPPERPPTPTADAVPPGARPVTLTVQRIRADVADVLGEDPADIPDDENLVDHGLDSVRIMSLVERWRREHGADVSFVALAERPAIDAWAPLLGARP